MIRTNKLVVFAWSVVISLLGSHALAGVDIEYRVVVNPADGQTQELISPDPVFVSYDGKEAEANIDFVNAVTRNLWHEEWGMFTGGNAFARIYFTPDTPTKFRVSCDYAASSGPTGSGTVGWANVSAGQDPPSAPQLSQYAPEFGTVSGSWSEIIDVRPGYRLYFTVNCVASNGEGIHHDASIYNLSVIPLPPGDLNFDMDVDGSDLAAFITAYLGETTEADLDLNGLLNETDLILFFGKFGSSE
jgi:hypothetical protein